MNTVLSVFPEITDKVFATVFTVRCDVAYFCVCWNVHVVIAAIFTSFFILKGIVFYSVGPSW